MIKVIDSVMEVVKKIIPDKEKQQEIELSLVENQASLQAGKVQIISKLVEKGCIPALFWLFAFIMFNNMVLSRYIEFFTGRTFPILKMDPNYSRLLEIITGFLFGKKTFEKFKK